MLTYQVFKMLHILGVVLFLGNIITATFWKTFADAPAGSRRVQPTAYRRHRHRFSRSVGWC
jgi:hypothetical protein